MFERRVEGEWFHEKVVVVVRHTGILTNIGLLPISSANLSTNLDIPTDKDDFASVQEFRREELEGIVALD